MAGRRKVAKLFTTHAETNLERTVRYELVSLNVPFEREFRVGRYTVDFLVKGRLVVEADGGAWHPQGDRVSTPWGMKKLRAAQVRDHYLVQQGYTILHLTEREIRGKLFKALLHDAIEALDE